jgi:hypothetical protein
MRTLTRSLHTKPFFLLPKLCEIRDLTGRKFKFPGTQRGKYEKKKRRHFKIPQ